uniref:NADH dehydrogenase subunit 5 n=1 Tax=Thyasira tokunagai TaxID=3055801 RepID=UPI0030FEF3E3
MLGSMFYSFNYAFLVEISFIKVGSFSFSLPILLSWENYLTSMVVCFVSGCVLMYSKAYMSEEKDFERFVYLVCLFVFSMNLLIFIPSMYFLFLGWDGLGIVSFILVIYYQNSKSLGSGMITILSNRIGDVFLFLSITLMSCLGYWFWEGFDVSKNFMSSVDFFILGFSLMVAGITKSAQFPFCAWLPAAMAAPTPVSALVHSSTLVTAGVFLFCRFSGVLLGSIEIVQLLFFISLFTMILSGGICCVEFDMKKVIAFSTLSQLGVMMFSFSLGLVGFSLFHLMTHAVFKALMFLCAGFVIYYSSHAQDVRCISGFWWISPLVSGSIITSALCLGGAPFLSGFYSKDLILEGYLMGSMAMGGMICLVVATSMTVCYSFRLCYVVLVGMKGDSIEDVMGGKVSFLFFFPMLSLQMLGIFEGALIQNFMMDYNSFEFVSDFLKVVLISILLISVFLGGVLVTKSISNSVFLYFFLSILYLSPLSGQVLSKVGLSVAKKSFEVMDQGVFEVLLGGKGLKVVGDYLSNKSMKVSALSSTYEMGFYFVIMFVIFSIFSFFLSF